MKIEIKNNCIVSDISRELSLEIQNRLTLDNPKYIDAIKQGYRPFTLPAALSFYTDFSDNGQKLEVPEGFICELKKMQKKNGSDPVIIDKRPLIDPVSFQFHGELRPSQARACEGLIHAEFGVLHAPTGSGKTAQGGAVNPIFLRAALLWMNATGFLPCSLSNQRVGLTADSGQV
ncbi:MAG: hypothetical protein U9P10_16160 [Thermodesulfobacteriota bacterium]|nr:hypothetical protein [Thermodesulfobacteriota bacterium]